MSEEKKRLDWQKIRADYVSNPQIGYRELSEKYGVSLSTISTHAKRDGWKIEREKLAKKTSTKTANALAEKNAKRIARVSSAADKLLRKLDKLIAACKPDDLMKNPKLIRALSGALKDIRDVLETPSEQDIREQEARIRKLEQEAKQGTEGSVTVTLAGDTDAYAQ